MIRIISLILSILFSASMALGQSNVIRPEVVETVDAARNYVKNPSAVRNTLGVTTSSAAKARVTTSGYKLDGIASFSCDSSADGGYCEWDVDAIGDQDKTGTCAASLVYKGDASLYRLQIHDGTSVVSQSEVLTNATDWTDALISFPCSSTTQKPRLTQSETGTGAIVYAGKVSYRKHPGIVGTGITTTGMTAYTPTFTGFGTVTVQESYWRQVGPNYELDIKFTVGTPTATEARISLPSGVALNFANGIRAAGYWFKGATDTSHGGAVLIEAGVGYITFSTNGIFSNASANPLTKANGSTIVAAGDIISLKASIPIAGLSGNTTANVVGLVPSPTSFSAKVSATGVLSDIVNSKYFNGSTFAPSDTSLYTINFQNLTSPPNCQVSLSTSDTTANWTVSMPAAATSSSVGVRTGFSTTASTFSKSPRVFVITCGLTGADYTNARNTYENMALGTLATPGGSSTEVVARAKITCSGSSSIVSQSGSWVSSIGNISAGQCTVTINGFASAPSCVISYNGGFTTAVVVSAEVTSSTSIATDCATSPSTACGSYDANLICMGPKQ